MNKVKILVTAIGTVNGSTVVNELKKNLDNVWIIGADINDSYKVATSKDVDEFYVFPSSVKNQEHYYEFVKRFCKKHQIDYVYCFIDEEVVILSRHRKELFEQGTTLCIADNITIERCHFKDIFCDWIEHHMPDIKIKRYSHLNRINEHNYPIFVKPVEGRASIDCRVIRDREELEVLLRDVGSKNLIFQEYIEGEVYAVDVVRNRRYNQLCIIQKKELLRNSNGCGIAVEIVNDEVLYHICKEIAEQMDVNGIINIEFFHTDQGFKIIEINPRLPAGTSYSCAAGCNTVMNALRIAKEERCEFGKLAIGKHFCRRYETYEM